MKSHYRCVAAALLVVAVGVHSVAHAASVSGQGTWETTLQGRDLDGNPATIEVYYDTALNITWLANANLAASNSFGVAGIDAFGRMSWATAQSWIGAMNSANYLGFSDWRLPAMNPINGSTFNYSMSYDGSTDLGFSISAPGTIYAGSSQSEMAHLFYNTLGNMPGHDYSGKITLCGDYLSCLENTGPFNNMLPSYYWYGRENALVSGYSWIFSFPDGFQFTETGNLYAWAVRAGDISVVPVPAAVWLFGSGLLGLIGVSRRKAA